MKEVPGTVPSYHLLCSWLNIWQAVARNDVKATALYVEDHASMFSDKENRRIKAMEIIEHAKHDKCLSIDNRIMRIRQALCFIEEKAA